QLVPPAVEHNEHADENEYGEIEPVVTKLTTLNQNFADEMKKAGEQCEAIELGSHPIEQKPYYSYLFPMTPRLLTNRGLVRVTGRNIEFIQVLQRI
ncbi:MAG: hypothetical protein ACRD98_07005, partial [Nitrososphaera sp.]